MKGVVRVLAVAFGKCTADLHGHTQAVNDVKFHPKMNDLLFSASKVCMSLKVGLADSAIDLVLWCQSHAVLFCRTILSGCGMS